MAASPSGDAVTTKAGVIAGFFVSAVALANRPARLRHGAAVYHGRMDLLKLAALFFITAIAEIVGCYLPWLVLRQDRSPWLLLPAALSLALFAWLLTLHPTGAARTYAAYGGAYIAVALLWLRLVDGVALTRYDGIGAALALAGMAVIALQPHT